MRSGGRRVLAASVALAVGEAALLGWLFWGGGPAARHAPPVPFRPSHVTSGERSSVLLIVTDDQRWDMLRAMPTVESRIVRRGVEFRNAFVSNPLCCPSRSSILTGDYSHTTLVYRQTPPYGRFDWFDDRSTVATWLRSAGYATGFFGKYLDGYQHAGLTGYVPPGWERWVAFIHSGYYDYGLSVDGRVERHEHARSDYSTDVLAQRAESFIRRSHGPVFVEFAPAAPHAPAVPAPEHADAFANLRPWRPPSYDEADPSDKPRWMRDLPSLAGDAARDEDRFRRDQYASLLSVDSAVGRLLGAFADTGRLQHTLVIFTSDNGLLWGEHRWTKKEVPYEESIRVPMAIRYDPAIRRPRSDGHLVLNIDLAPTIAQATRAGTPRVDGRSLLPLLRSPDVRWRSDFLLEHMMGSNPVPTYCGVRNTRFAYVRYSTGEEELYDLRRDPYELANRAYAPSLARTLAELRSRLSDLCDPPPPQLRTRSRVLPLAGAIALPLLALGALLYRRRVRVRASA